MGVKGDKILQASVLITEAFLERINPIENISSKKIFGGHRILHEGELFGIEYSRGKHFIKVDEGNRKDNEAKGAEQEGRMPYFSVPDAVLTDSKKLQHWAKNSIKTSL